MTINNQIPESEATAISQTSNPASLISDSDKDLKDFIDSLEGGPASLEKSQAFKFEEWLKESGVARRVALSVATKPYDELKKGILNDRDIAIAFADAERSIEDVVSGLKLILNIAIQSRCWILSALSARDDCDEIMAEVHNNVEGI